MEKEFANDEYNFISIKDKEFITAFDKAINEIGYSSGNTIGSGYCWGRYMIIYSKTGVKDKKVAARIYIRDDSIMLRLFFSNIDKHREYIEKAPEFIRQPFINKHGDCNHCHNEKEGLCRFRKTYTMDNRLIEKCNGFVFEFANPDTSKIPEYIAILKEFYQKRKGG